LIDRHSLFHGWFGSMGAVLNTNDDMKLVWGLALALTVPALTATGAADAVAPEIVRASAPGIISSNWSGGYVGLNIGYGAAGLTDNNPLSTITSMQGFVAGTQFGYNWQRGAWVFGAEMDFHYSGQQREFSTDMFPALGLTPPLVVGQKIPWLATARGRVGYDFDRTLVYATAGLGYGRHQLYGSFGPLSASIAHTSMLYVAGLGIETMFTEKMSAKVELLYLDTGNKASVTAPLVGSLSKRARGTLVRLGLNYKIGGSGESLAMAPSNFDWSGAYGGVNAGYGTAGLSDSAAIAGISAMSGVIGGAQAGYNLQRGDWVYGIEADIQYSDQKRTLSVPFLGFLPTVTAGHKIPWFGTVRGRIGRSFNRSLIYATAGVGYGKYEMFVSAAGNTFRFNQSKAALATGAGIEFMVTDQMSAKAEFLYLDTGNGTSVTLPGIGALSSRARDAVTRFGMNYHF
jgi:outer membrane immunogenic protein